MIGRAAAQVGTIAGIPLRVHVSWLVALFLATSSLSVQLASSAGRAAPFVALLTALLLFAALVAHELGHSLVARRRGVGVSSITLFVFGGVASLDSEPRRPRDELAIAIAGPLVSVAIGIAALALSWVGLPPIVAEPLRWLGRVNLGIAVFNLMPGFPLDGGRILRGALWAWNNDAYRATSGAARVGRGIAYGIIALGVALAMLGSLGDGFWIGLVGWFLLAAARAAAADADLRAAIGDVPIERAMLRDFPSVQAALSLASFVEDVVAPGGGRVHVVVDGHDVVGVVTFERVLAVPRSYWGDTTVGQVAMPISSLPMFDAGTPMLDVLARIGDTPLAFVRDAERLVGVVDRERLASIVRVRLDLETEQRRRWTIGGEQPG